MPRKERFKKWKIQQDGEATERAAAMLQVEGAGEEGKEEKNPYKKASQDCVEPSPYSALRIACEAGEEPPKKS